MTIEQARRYERWAQLVFYGLIGLLGIAVGVAISSLVLSVSPAAGFAVMAAATFFVVVAISALLRWLISRPAKDHRSDDEVSELPFLTVVARLIPQVGSYVYPLSHAKGDAGR